MTIPRPDVLFQQAQMLTVTTPTGGPKPEDLRRAVSTTYYALFHAIVAGIADQIAGANSRGGSPYHAVYRSIEHAQLRRALTHVLGKGTPSMAYKKFAPADGFTEILVLVARAFNELQEKRMSADYDPAFKISVTDTKSILDNGRDAHRCWRELARREKRAFALLVVFGDRVRA